MMRPCARSIDRRLTNLERDTAILAASVHALKTRIRALCPMGHVYALKTTDRNGVVRTVSPYDLLAGAAAAVTSVENVSIEAYSESAHTCPRLWAVHNIEAIPALAAIHKRRSDAEDNSYLIVAGHIVRVNSPKFVENGAANYAQCILPACSAVYAVENFDNLSPDIDAFAGQALKENECADGLFDLATFPQIMPYVAALRALRDNFYLVGDGFATPAAVTNVAEHPVAGSVVRMFLLMFQRFNPTIAQQSMPECHVRIAWTFASNFWTKFDAARSTPRRKVSYPAFSGKVSDLRGKASATYLSAMHNIAQSEELQSELAKGPGDMILAGLGKMLLGIPNTVDSASSSFKRALFSRCSPGIPRPWLSSKELFDYHVRQPIFRDNDPDPTRNNTSLCAEIVAAMVFSETVRWPLQLIDVMGMLVPNLSGSTAPPIEDMFFSENGGKRTDDGRQASLIGPYGELIQGRRWAGIFPMSHNGSVGDADEATGPKKDKQLNPLLMKCMRLYAVFFERKLGNPLRNGGLSLELVPVHLGRDDTLAKAQDALGTTFETLQPQSSPMYVYLSLVDNDHGIFGRSLLQTSIDHASSHAKPDLPAAELVGQTLYRILMGDLQFSDSACCHCD